MTEMVAPMVAGRVVKGGLLVSVGRCVSKRGLNAKVERRWHHQQWSFAVKRMTTRLSCIRNVVWVGACQLNMVTAQSAASLHPIVPNLINVREKCCLEVPELEQVPKGQSRHQQGKGAKLF